MARPRLFNTADEFTTAVDAFFEECTANDVIPTVNGLCLALGCCRDTIWDYSKQEEFSYAVKRARTRLELAWENRLAGQNCTGAIFWLKNQGWTDRTELAHSGHIKTTNELTDDELANIAAGRRSGTADAPAGPVIVRDLL